MKPEIVAYAKERYEEEHKRFDHMENKCGKLMSFITILITAITGLLAFFSTAVFSPKGLLDWAILIVTVGAVFVLICSWWHALLSLKLGTVNIAPTKDENFTYMAEKTDEEMYKHMVNCYLGPLRKLTPKIDEKAKYLKFSYEELTMAGGFLALLLLLTFIREVIKC